MGKSQRIAAALTAVVALLAAGEGALAAQKQGPPAAVADSAGLARAVASVLADSVLPRYRRTGNPLVIRWAATPFDSAVAGLLRAAKGVDAPVHEEKSRTWVGTRGVTLRGDTAAVLVETGEHSRDARPISTYIEENRYLFVRGPGGWRYVRREFVRGMDLGGVRG